MESQVILVNENDEQLGVMGKTETHEKGLLHRAFSIFIFNGKGEMLLQRRALHKYHSPGLWSNACCSHPAPMEKTEAAAHRRLLEELGFDTNLEKAFDFIYRADVGGGLTEHEFDHVFTGTYNGQMKFNEDEVMNIEFRSIDTIRDQLEKNPEQFSVWFKISFPRVITHPGPSA